MADEKTEAVTVDDMYDYMALDPSVENNTVLTGLIKASEDIIRAGFNSQNLSASTLNSDDTYVEAVKALTSYMFNDRSLSTSTGMPDGVKMMITILQGRYDQWPNTQNGNSSAIKPTSSTE